jgi:hypothetical protein
MPPVTTDAGRWDRVPLTAYTLFERSDIHMMSAAHICANFALGGFQAEDSNQFGGLGQMDLRYKIFRVYRGGRRG